MELVVVFEGHATLQGTRQGPGLSPSGMVQLTDSQGEVEKALLIKMRASMLSFQAYIVQPAAIIPENPGWLIWALSFVAPSVRLDELAAVMIDLAFNGMPTSDMSNTLDVSALGKRGRELLRRTKRE